MARAKTKNEAATALGISERQLTNWYAEPWFKKQWRTNGWDVDAIAAARNQLARKGSPTSETSQKIREATAAQKLRREKTRADREELFLKRDQGELIPRQAVELFAATLLMELSDWAEQLPDIIGNTVPAKYRKKLKARIKSELDQRRVATRERLEREARHLDSKVSS